MKNEIHDVSNKSLRCSLKKKKTRKFFVFCKLAKFGPVLRFCCHTPDKNEQKRGKEKFRKTHNILSKESKVCVTESGEITHFLNCRKFALQLKQKEATKKKKKKLKNSSSFASWQN